MVYAAFKKGPEYQAPEKPRVIIQKPEISSFAIPPTASGNSVGLFYKLLLALAALCSLANLWLAFHA